MNIRERINKAVQEAHEENATEIKNAVDNAKSVIKHVNKLKSLCSFILCDNNEFCKNELTEIEFEKRVRICLESVRKNPRNMNEWGKHTDGY